MSAVVMRSHERWAGFVHQLKAHAASIGYLAVSINDRNIGRFDWTPEACAKHGHAHGNPGDAQAGAQENSDPTMVSYREAVASWLGETIAEHKAAHPPGGQYKVRVYVPGGMEALFVSIFTIADAPSPAAVARTTGASALAALDAFTGADDGADDASPDEGADDADADADGADAGADDAEEAPAEVLAPRPKKNAAGKTKPGGAAGRGKGVKVAPSKRNDVSLRSALAGFAPLTDGDDLNVDLGFDGGIDDLDIDVDVAEYVEASRLGLQARMYRHMQVHLSMIHTSHGAMLGQFARLNSAFATALESQTATTLALVDTLADMRLKAVEQIADAERDAGKRATIEKLGGAAIAQGGALLRAKAVLDKVDHIDGDRAAGIALEGTGLEGTVGKRAAAPADAPADAASPADGTAVVEDAESAVSVETVEAVVVNTMPRDATKDEEALLAMLRAKPWIADGLRDPSIAKALNSPEAIDKIRQFAPMLGAFSGDDTTDGDDAEKKE